ncbi:TetR/AcrR family transcriptional regulator [Actinacidiphila glaucinigra]|uniref:TetR/AcrR family transcriptional regulator n=1 Tax=Actinacidiphila glaucinigra TaxID=235986 RepID=UPI0036D0BA04
MRHDHDPPHRERVDAARNRAAILKAAALLFAEHGADAVSMDRVAAAAGVGKGTVYRRFGDRSGLAAALLAARERELREAVVDGPPPLGPGAPAGARLAAFVGAYLDHVAGHLDLLRTSETSPPGARYRSAAYRFWHDHLTSLLDTAPDPHTTAHTLLAALSAEHVGALLPELGAHRLRMGLLDLAAGCAAPDAPPGAVLPRR